MLRRITPGFLKRVTGLFLVSSTLGGCSRSDPAAKEAAAGVSGSSNAPNASGIPSQPLPPSRPGTIPLGLNLAAVQDWSREWAFIDVFKGAREWTATGGGELKFDKNGNPLPAPGQTAWTLVLRELDGHYPSGKYTVTWKGSGTVEVKRWDVTQVLETSNGRAVIDVRAGDGGIQIDLKLSRADDPIRDFHVWMPGYENARSPFHPTFIERLKPAKVIRFMDWQRTNNSKLVKWADRPKPEDPTYATDRGVPVEVMVMLANTAKIDPWFCMPHQADDDFIRQFARTVKAGLDPGRTVYVEYGNEVWNWQFEQTRWARDRGKEQKLGDPEHARFYSERAVEVMKIWEEEFGRERLVRVLASQAAVPWLSERILTWKDAYKHADVLAIAPYFGYEYGDPKTTGTVTRMTPEQLLNAIEKEIDGPNRDMIRKQAGLAKKHGLRLVAYEGGQHLVGIAGAENNENLTRLFHAANRNPRTYDLYRRHLQNWADEGGDVYLLFNYVTAPSKWGAWGLLEYQDQPTREAPKYRAFVDVGSGR